MDWRTQAACLDAPDPDIFHPEPGQAAARREALTYCARCPVVAECKADGEGLPGVWGGVWTSPLNASFTVRLPTRDWQFELGERRAGQPYSVTVCNLDECLNLLPPSRPGRRPQRYCCTSHTALAKRQAVRPRDADGSPLQPSLAVLVRRTKLLNAERRRQRRMEAARSEDAHVVDASHPR